MTSRSIHRLVALCVAFAVFVLFMILWISGGDGPRNPAYLVWTIFSLVGTLAACVAFVVSLKRSAPGTDWAPWVIPLPFQLAGVISAFL